MKLHLPKSLRTALLSCLAAISPWSLTLASGAISVGAVAFVLAASEAQASASFSDATTVVDDVTYAGYILSLDVPATSANFHEQTFECTYLNPSGQEVTANIGTSNAGPCNQPGWYYFANGGSITSTAGNTLHLTGIENDVTMTTTFTAFSIGGLIVDGQEQTNYTYTLGRPNADKYEIYFEAASGTAVNADINSNVIFKANHNTAKVLFKNGGTWDIASGIKLSFETPVLTFQNTVTDLVFCGGGEVDMGGASVSIASGAKVSIGDNTTLRLGNNATAATGTGVLSNSGQIYLNNHTNAFTLVNNEGGAVIVSGASSIGSISNAGILRFDEGSSLTLGSMANDFYGGKTYSVGNLALTSGGAVSNWAPYFGYNDGTEMSYENGQLTVTVDGSGYYWNGTADSYSWSAANSLKGGNAATIAAGGRLYLTDSATHKTVHMDTTMALGSVYLYSNGYTLHVTADNTIPANFVVGDSSYSLTKTGAATLSMTSAQAAKLAGIAVNDGTLKITDTVSGDISNGDGGIATLNIDKDFSGITGAGTLAVTLTGGSTYGSNNRSTIKLDSGFTGTLEVLGGSLDRLSTLGNATVKLNNGGLFGRETPSGGPTHDFANNLIIEGNSWLIGQGNGGKMDTYAVHLTGSVSGSGTLAFTGECDWYFKGDMSGFDGSVALSDHYDYIVFEKSVNVKDLTFGTRHDNNSCLVMGNGTAAMTFGITNAMTVGNVATFDIKNNATVVNTGLLTVNANFNVTGAGAYEMNGGLVINSGKTLTLNVAEASIASITNNGTLTLGADLTSLTLGDFVVGTDYEIGTVTDGAGKDWYGLLGLSQGDYSIVYENGVLKTAVLNSIVWSSPADDDITWGGANNWSQNGNNVELTGADVLVLDVRADNSAVSNRIQFTDNATAESVTVKDDYTFVVEEGGDYSLDASVALTGDGAIAKDGAGKLTINSGLTTNALTVSAGTLVVDDVTLASGNTFTKDGSGNLELGTVNGATKLTLNGGDTELTAWSVASGTTVTKVGTGTLTISGDASALKGNLDVKDGDVTFLTDAAIGNLTIREIFVNIGDDNTHVNVSFANSTFSGFSGKVMVAAGSTLTGESVIVNNSTYRLSGGGVYNVGRLVFATSAEGNMNVGAGLTVNVTGTTTSADAGTGSFVMGGAKSTITVDGTLSLASGVSATGGGAHTFDVSNGGTLWLKDGLQATLDTNVTTVATINVNSGATMIVDGSKTDNTTAYTVALKDGSSVFTTQGATVLNAMGYTGSVKLGAAAGTTLSLTAENPSVGALTILGTADTVKGVAGGGTVSYTGALSGTSVTLNEGAKFEATAGLNLTGALTLGANAEATLGGVVALSSLSNAGSINVAAITGLSLGDISMQAGATYNVGELVGYENLDWGSLLGAQDYLSVSYDAGRKMLVFTGNAEHPILWVGTEGETWDSTAADGTDTQTWSLDGAPIALQDGMPVVLGNAASLGELNDTVTRTIVLDADTVVGSVTVQDAYSFSVAEGETYSFDANSIVLEADGSLRKVGTGTLSMSVEDAVAAKMTIAAGTLSLSDTLADYNAGTRADLTALSGSGTLAITAAGTSGATGNGTGQRSSIDLADSFTGTLAVVGGNLDMASTIGGTGSVLLDGATLVGTGSVVQELGWNIAVSDKGAYLRRFGNGNSDERTSYATRLNGTLTGSAETMLTVIDSGEWFLAGDMSGYHGGLSIEGDTNYVTFESSATLASLSAVNGSRIFVDNGATLNTATAAVSGTVTTGATEGATFNMGAATVNADGTLKIEGAGAHTLSTLAMGNNATLELGANTNASITTATAGTTTGDSGHPGARDGVRELNGVDFTIKVGTGAELTDAGAWELSGGSDMTVSGGGVYHVAGVSLGVNASHSNSLTIGDATTLHITGTNTTGSKFGDSFSLGNWDPDNTVTVNGVLALECGISTYKKASNEGSSYRGYAAINVGEGGKIAFNNGLHAVSSGRGAYTNADGVPDSVKEGFRHVYINIAGGGVLEVSGTNVTGTNQVVVNVAKDGFVLGGNANGATESVIANNMVIQQGFYTGAAAGTTLTFAPESGNFNFESASSWVDVLGTAAGLGGKVVFDVQNLELNALKVYAGAQASIISDARLYVNQYGGVNVEQGGTLSFDGAGEITLGQAIKNGGTVEILNAADTQFVLSDALLQEVVGVSKTWTLVNNTGVKDLTGTITGWDELGLGNFLLDGSALQLGDWDGYSIADGKVMLYMLSRYWDATGADGVWNTGADANWREFADSTETVTFETNSRVTFTDTDETGDELDKSVTVADGGVHAKSVTITGSDYVFSGGKVLVNQSLSAQQDARFDSAVVIGSAAPLQLDVADGATLTLSTLETVSTQSYGGVSYGSGAFSKTGAGTLLITDAINGTITGATVSGGKLQLGSGVNLAVGANTLTGGTLENVVLLATGTVTDYTGATAQANNVIKSADGENYATLTNVALQAGAATGYASLQKVAFAGTSTLSGFITFEDTKQQRQMAVATGGTLTVSNLTLDLHGLSTGTKVLIENGAVAGAAEGFKGTLEGWTAENVKLLYSGVAVNNAVVDMGTAGVVTLNTAEDNTAANMYWDGLVAGAAEDDAPVASTAWDKSSANWSATAGENGDAAFLALSNAYFGATPEGGSKAVNAVQDMVMANMFVTEGGYSFTGSRLATLGNMHITPASGAVSFTNELVAQGNVELSAAQGGSVTLGGALQAGGAITATGEGSLSFNSTVQSGGDITLTGNGVVMLAGNVSTAGNFSIGTEGAAVMDKADASTLYTIAGALTAKNILINMDASTLTAAADTGDHLVVSGNVSAMGDAETPAADGTITLLGSAAKKFTGLVTADTLRVSAAHGTLNNVITFNNVVDVNTLEIAEDTYVRIVHADSDMDTVLLGGTLYMDTVGVTYDNGYDIYSTSDNAELVFGTISSNTINLISGLTPAEAADDVADAGQYNSISVNANTRFLTVNALADLKDLTLYNGPMTVKAGEGAIHGNLVVRDAASLVLTQNANNIMAEGSGSITVDHANINLNATTQTLRDGNVLYLAGGAITGNASGVGLNFVGTGSLHYTGNSTVSANMTVATGSALTVNAGKMMEDTLTISGTISGSGNITMQGDGRVLLSGANTAYTGTVTVQQNTGLKLGHVDALAAAQLNLAADGTLLVDCAVVNAPYNIGTLNMIAPGAVTLNDGSTLTAGSIQINGLSAMDAISAADAALNVGSLLVSADQTLNLTLAFGEGESLQTMKTYNLFTSAKSLAEVYKSLNVELYIAANNISNHVASSQYKVVYDETANVIAIRTMLGNIWDGGADGDGDGIWAVSNAHKNWTGKDYDEASAYNDAIFADLTGEGIGESAVVTINGTVAPGEIYFEADNTKYVLNATEDGAMLAAGNVIHKAGKAEVTLNLANNDTVESALGGLDLQAGTTSLAADLAVAGEVSVEAGTTLQTTGDSRLLMVGGDAVAYTAQGAYSGLTMDAAGIVGVAGTPGTVTNGIINGAAELNYLNLTGNGTLTGVTIGSGVNVTADSGYTLNGHITFLDTLQNAGTVTLDAAATVEIGGLGYTYGVADSDEAGAQYGVSAGGSYYMYQLVQGGTINGMTALTVDDVYVNGVKLGGSNSGLADGMAAVFTNNNGVLTLSIGAITSDDGEKLTVDGSVGMPSWDERWGKSDAEPALSRRYAGTDAQTNISFAENNGYLYGAVVNAENAAKVNAGKAVVVTLSSAATGNRAAGGGSATNLDHEIWVYDRSGFKTVIAGQYADSAADYTQTADTHVLVNSTYDGADEGTAVDEKAWVVGGSWNVAQQANSYVTMQDGQVLTLVGGSVNSNQTGTSYVYIDGGRVFEVVGSSYADDGKSVTHTVAEGETLASRLVITGGVLGGLASDSGTKSVYGGGIRANITGDIHVTVDGTATITNLVGGNYAGSVDGDITLDLVNGTANTVNAAGAGGSTVTCDVNVYLSRDFDVTTGLYGGKQNNSGVTVSGTSTLYLSDAGEYVFAQWQGDAAGTHDGLNQELVEGSAVTIEGFDVVSLAQGTVLTVDTRHFDRNITGDPLVITGNGIVQMGGDGGARRDICLENGAIFKILSSYTANNYSSPGNKYADYSKLYVTDGTTFDISGYPRENSANDGGGSISYHVYLSGDGVDGMGALYKGATDKNNSTNPSGKAALGYIELTGNASATAEHNIAMIGPNNATTYLDLNGYTFTKRGEGAYVLRNTEINGGTYYGHEGTVQPEQTSTGKDADLVLAAAATLKLNDNCNFTMRSLTGTGATDLGAFKLTLAPVSDGKYYAEFMDEANSYDNLMSGTGFAYGVYSGVITGSGSLYIGNKSSMSDRKGVQYLSGTDSTYSGGTHVEAGRLYLLSSTQGSISKGGSEVTSGPIGTGALYWDSTTAEVYLGHGVTVYNAGGTNVAGSDLILGVEGAPDGDLLKNYPGVNGTVVKDGVTYHEVDTHNLQSISCNGVYADGTLYTAGTEIDRSKMLLVTEAAWNSESSTVKGFTDTGYNEATYSGVLSGDAALVKVGDGTLVIDQANAYTGGTRIEAGTLKLKGWAQIGAAADGTIDVTQTDGTSLMLAYDGTYGDELTSISNNMVLNGTGDARWEDSEETGGGTAALISDVGSGVTFTLSGDISGEGNLLHSGEGTLVLSGDSSFTGGTHATGGVVEVQSATGLGAGVVNIESNADLHVTVEEGTTDARVATTLAAAGTTVQGDVVISGTESTERILNVATGGYDNSSTTLHDNGTLLVNGEGVSAETALLTGSGTVAVSDATGSGAKATVGQMTDYTGDLHVEGNNASIVVGNGSFSGGSISVSGNDAVVSTKGDITITNGESLSLSSRGNAGAENDAAYVTTTGAVSVGSGATLSVSDAATSYEYNLQNLQAAASLNGVADLESVATTQTLVDIANIQNTEHVYNGAFNTDGAMNQKAAGAVDAKGGLTMASGSTYETAMANTSLMGGSLTLESGLTLSTTLDLGQSAIDGAGRTTQLVLFSDVNSVNFVLDNLTAVAKSGIYYTKAENYITGSYIDEDTWLVYDSGAGVVYLDGIVPEPTTATLSLLALAALAARRRRR